MPAGNILGGFFFIHENQSKTEGDLEKFNYEFLHKTFGEFLAADFILRIAEKQYKRVIDNNQEIIAKKETFNFCFGYNWLHKHSNIQNFLFEHAKQIIKPESQESKFIINSIIKADLKDLFDKAHQSFPVAEKRLLEHKTVIEHLGIYSQNIVFLWLAIANDDIPTKFQIFDVNEHIGEAINEPKYESQDRDEINKNKLLWKRLTKLWALVGNYSAAAKLIEWISVNENTDSIELNKTKSEVIHNFSNSATIGCNDFELLLSFFDNEYKFSDSQSTLNVISEIISKKPELFSLAVDAVLHRFSDLYSVEKMDLFDWFLQLQKELNRKQQISLIKKTGMLKWLVEPRDLEEIIRHIMEKMSAIFRENIQATIELLKILVELKSYFPFYRLFNTAILDEILYRFTRDFGRFERDNPIVTLEYIRLVNELNKTYPFRRKFKIDFLEESLHRLTKDIRHFVRENTFSAFEYLRLINELRQFYPIRKMHPELLDEAIHILAKDSRNIIRDNPHAILEYLKLISDLKEHFPIKERLPRDFFVESLKYITEDWDEIFGDNHFNLLEYLKILSEFGKEFSMSEYIPYELLRKAFHRFSKEMIYIVRDNPKEAQAYFDVIRQYYKNYRKGKPRHKEQLFLEPFFTFSKEMEMELRDNPQTMMIYLELALLCKVEHWGDSDGYSVERIVDMLRLRKKDYPDNFLIKATAILIKYDASSNYVERLLEDFPKVRGLFSNSPELAMQVIEATAELIDHERFS